MKPRSLTLRVVIGSLCLIILLIAFNVLIAPPAGASGVDDVVIALHVQAHVEKAAFLCTSTSPNEQDPPLSCSEYNTQGSLRMPLDVYVVVARGDTIGISGVTFGIDYDGAATGTGLDILSWNVCASGLEFQSTGWPGPATGNIVTWVAPEACATQLIGSDGVHGVVGAFYVYAYDEDILRLRDHPLIETQERLAASDCFGVTAFLDPDAGITGAAAFTNHPWSCNPCIAPCMVPARSTTWGALKRKYKTF